MAGSQRLRRDPCLSRSLLIIVLKLTMIFTSCVIQTSAEGACADDSECLYGGTCDLTSLMCTCATGYSGTNCGTGTATVSPTNDPISVSIVNLTVGETWSISSPNYPREYPNNAYYTWYITAPSNYSVIITFIAFNLETCCDLLSIGNGHTPGNLVANNFSGQDIPASVRLYSSNSWMRFTSDGSVTHQGFQLQLTVIAGALGACDNDTECLNGGTCEITSLTCTCATGYTGIYCETVIGDCAKDSECLNGGTCDITSFTCTCATGYWGTYCGTVIGACAMDSECLNGGTCNVTSSTCTCATGYTGLYCETDACAMDSECLNGGTCEITSFTCTCAAGYWGTYCGTFIGACAVDWECQHGGTCDSTSLMCTCASGYSGTNCGTGACAIDSECLNGGTCEITSLTCTCATGYTGTNCATGACADNSECQHGGTCESTTLMCTCATGYSGTNCGTGACADNSACQYGGTCDMTTLTCTCATGYSGTTCGTGACADDSDCQHGGTCDTTTLTCTCATGYTGTNCGTEEQPFVSHIRIEITANRRTGNPLEFSKELEDQNSAAFKELEIIFCGATTSYLNTSLNSPQLTNIKCYVLSFRSGSVIGDLLIAIEATSQASADSIGDKADELSPGNGTYQYLNENLYVAEFASDNNDSCEINPCQDGGTCADGFNAFTCACPLDYTGEDCLRNSGRHGLSPGDKVGIIVGAMSGAICFVVCTCCVMLQIVRRNKGNKIMTGERRPNEYRSENKRVFDEEWSKPSPDDRTLNFSLDRRQYEISQAVDRMRHYQGIDRPMAETNFDQRSDGLDNFIVPDVTDGQSSTNVAVERNPIHDRYY